MKPARLTSNDVLNYFKSWNLSDQSEYYLKFHKERYSCLLNIVMELCREYKVNIKDREQIKILDIGRGFQTELVRHFADASVFTLDNVKNSRFTQQHGVTKSDIPFLASAAENNFHFDLNDTLCPGKLPKIGIFSIIIMAEVLEHLIVSPECVFLYLASLLDDKGYVVVQTPNAASFKARVQLLFGKNPYALPPNKKCTQYPHMREYTMNEMCVLAKSAGLQVKFYRIRNYFNVSDKFPFKVYKFIMNTFFPSTFRSGMTFVFMKA